MYDVIITRDFSKSFPLIARIFIFAAFNLSRNSDHFKKKFVEIRWKIRVLRFFGFSRDLSRKPVFGIFWALKGPNLIILTPVLFNMLYNVILHLSMKFGGYKGKNKDFMT